MWSKEYDTSDEMMKCPHMPRYNLEDGEVSNYVINLLKMKKYISDDII